LESERWHQVEQLFHSALAVDESERADFVEKACGGDEFLKREVASLLAQGADSFLEAPAMDVAARALAVSAAAGGARRSIPATVGRYRVVRLVGEGGMGAVYEAEQEQPRRVVALKLIKPGFATAEAMRRFQYECRALGRLQHPGIAQIYEAGTADTGFGPQPFFAMELIRGRPLLEYAEAHQLDTRERLALMVRICDAAGHAHQRGVIHRDLKPGNILVDETGQPKILDFGVARVTESDAQLTQQTALGQLVGTLAYMSPEQVTGDPQALDIRSDVYALGLILYELLAGGPPYDIERKPLSEAVAVIREKEPAPLGSIHRSFRGDIETIAAKALEKEKGRRYASAADLAADLRRCLADEPIAARPASASYQVQKFARRHKALVAGTVAVFVALAAGAAASTWEAIRARKAEWAAVEQRDRATAAEARAQQERNAAIAEKRRADSEAATAQAISDFLQNDLLAQASVYGRTQESSQPDPELKPDPNMTVRTALDRAAARIQGKFDQQPEVEAAIRETIGHTYMGASVWTEGRKQFERVLELRRRVWGLEDPKTLHAMSLTAWALMVEGKHAPAEAIYREELEISRRRWGPEHSETLYAMEDLAFFYTEQGRYAQAEALQKQVLNTFQRLRGVGHSDTLSSLVAVAKTYLYDGKYAQAEPLQKQVLEIERRVSGPDRAAPALLDLARIYDAQGKYEQAEGLYRQALESSRRIWGPQDPQTLFCLSYLGNMYQRQGKYALAETYAGQVLAERRRAYNADHPLTLDALGDLVLAKQSQGQFAASESLARQALEMDRNKRPDDWQCFRTESLLGASLAGQKKYAEAEPLLLEGYRGMAARKSRIRAPDRYNLELAREWIVQLYNAWGRPEQAGAWAAGRH